MFVVVIVVVMWLFVCSKLMFIADNPVLFQFHIISLFAEDFSSVIPVLTENNLRM